MYTQLTFKMVRAFKYLTSNEVSTLISRLKKIILPYPLEAPDCLCDLDSQDSQWSHLHQACQAVQGILSPPLSQSSWSTMTLPFAQEALEVPFHQWHPLEKSDCL